MLFNYMSGTETVVEPYSKPKNNPLGPQKVKNDPKIKSKSNVKIEGNIKTKVIQLHV